MWPPTYGRRRYRAWGKSEMFKFLVGLALGAIGLYAAQELRAASNAGPDFRVWVSQTPIPLNDDLYDMLNVHSTTSGPASCADVSRQRRSPKAGRPEINNERNSFNRAIFAVRSHQTGHRRAC